MRRLFSVLLFVLAIASAGTASAITIDDVKGLTRAGASDAIIISKIEADQTVFRLTVEEILDLKAVGVSDGVITFMINSGKVESEPPAQGEAVGSTPGQEESGAGAAAEPGDQGQDQGSVYVGIGGYYPHWPGYSWASYYDPFWWPDMALYFTYWQPYPYYYWYYDPFYSCHTGAYAYWYDSPRHDHDYAHHDGRDRYVGGRGSVYADRQIKQPQDRLGASRNLRSPVYAPGVERTHGRVVKSPSMTFPERRMAPPSTYRGVPRPPERVVKPMPGAGKRVSPPASEGRVIRPPRAGGRVEPSPPPSRVSRGEARRSDPAPATRAPRPSSGNSERRHK